MNTTNDKQQVTITVRLEGAVGYQLAQFCKRVGFATLFDYTEAHATQEERTTKAYQMLAGLDAVAAGLRDQGFRPR